MTLMEVDTSPAPSETMGIYKRFEDIPNGLRLTSFETDFIGEDTWSKFVEARDDANGGLSESRAWEYDRCGRTWKRHMRGVRRHHACARPRDVESFVSQLDADLTLGTLYETYFGPLYVFYDWLWHHAEYPHVYSSVLLAAAEGGTALKCWNYRMGLR